MVCKIIAHCEKKQINIILLIAKFNRRWITLSSSTHKYLYSPMSPLNSTNIYNSCNIYWDKKNDHRAPLVRQKASENLKGIFFAPLIFNFLELQWNFWKLKIHHIPIIFHTFLLLVLVNKIGCSFYIFAFQYDADDIAFFQTTLLNY